MTRFCAGLRLSRWKRLSADGSAGPKKEKVIDMKFEFSVKFGKSTPLLTVAAHGRLIALNNALIALPRFWNFEAITALLA